MPPSVIGPHAVQVRPRCFGSSDNASLVERTKRLRAGDHMLLHRGVAGGLVSRYLTSSPNSKVCTPNACGLMETFQSVIDTLLNERAAIAVRVC
jgi:hypothetical protein